MRANAQRAFSLVELMIVSGVLGILSVMIAAGLQQGQEFASSEMSVTTSEMKVALAIDKVRSRLAVARVDEPVADGNRIRFMVPIDHDGDGLSYDQSGNVTFGYDVGGVPTIGAAAWFQFAFDRTITEQEMALDANGDGDLDDAFELGHVELLRPGGGAIPITGSWLLQEAGNPGGDFDGDLAPDPMFDLQESGHARLVRLRFFLAYRVADGSWRRLDHDSSVRLRNDA